MRHSLLAALIAGLSSAPAEAACALVGESISPAMQIRYDPFSPVQQTLDLKVRVRSSGDACQAHLYLRPVSGATSLLSNANRLQYRLDGQIGAGQAQAGERGPFVTMIPAGATGELVVRVVLPPQQVVPPGLYGDDLELRADTQDGEAIPLAGNPVRFEANVPARAEMSISGTAAPSLASTSMAPASINFPDAMAGLSDRVFVNVWANGSVLVSLKSENGGVLKHTDHPELPPIAYTARFHGRPLSLGAAAIFEEAPPLSLAGASYELAVTLGDAVRKYAGRYRDVIMVSIDQN